MLFQCGCLGSSQPWSALVERPSTVYVVNSIILKPRRHRQAGKARVCKTLIPRFESGWRLFIAHIGLGRTEASKRRSHSGSTEEEAASSDNATPVAPIRNSRSLCHWITGSAFGT